MLSTTYVHHRSINKAAGEAMGNIALMLIAGFHEEALTLSNAFLQPGPWQANPNTAQIQEVHRLHKLLCYLCDRDCPAIADEPAISHKKLARQATDHWNTEFDALLMSDRLQTEPAGANWCPAFFDKLAKQPETNQVSREYATFVNDIDWVLKHRLRAKTNRQLPQLLPDCLAKYLPDYQTDNDILLSANTSAYDSHWLTDTLTEHLIRNSEGRAVLFGYMDIRIFLMQLIMDILNRDHLSETRQIERLLMADDNTELLNLVYWPELRDRIKSGVYRQATGLTTQHVEAYLLATSQRRVTHPQPVVPTTEKSTAVSLKAFRSISQNTDLQSLDWIELPVPQSDRTALAASVNYKTAMTLWELAMTLKPATKRSPVIVLNFGIENSDWKQSLIEENLFDRELIRLEHYNGDRIGLSVDELVAGADNVDLAYAYHERDSLSYESIAEYLSYGVDDIDDSTRASIENQINPSDIGAYARVEKLVAEHIIDKSGLPAPCPIEWYEPSGSDQLLLFLMPTRHSWEIPAYLPWYGAEGTGTEVTVAQLKAWHEQYSAELVCHYLTMLQLTVSRRPDSIDEAIDLVYAQNSLASCTLGCSSTAEYAAALMHSDKWFLHERP